MAATVGRVPIYVVEVHQRVRRALGDRTLDEPVLHRLQAEVLEQLVKQQLVLAALEKRGEACNQEQVDLVLSRLKDTLNRQEKTLDDYCREQGTCRQALSAPHAGSRPGIAVWSKR